MFALIRISIQFDASDICSKSRHEPHERAYSKNYYQKFIILEDLSSVTRISILISSYHKPIKV